MYKKILCTMAAFILSTNIVFAEPKNSIKDINTISNSLNTLFLSILKDDDSDKIGKDIKFIQSQISREKKEILTDIEGGKREDKVAYLSLLSILNYYEISMLLMQDYLEKNDNQSFIMAVSSFNEGETIFETVKSRLNYK